jgi:hypothetical protein
MVSQIPSSGYPILDLILLRMPLAENWRRRGKFEEVAFVFPNAPTIPITAV